VRKEKSDPGNIVTGGKEGQEKSGSGRPRHKRFRVKENLQKKGEKRTRDIPCSRTRNMLFWGHHVGAETESVRGVGGLEGGAGIAKGNSIGRWVVKGCESVGKTRQKGKEEVDLTIGGTRGSPQRDDEAV